MFKNLDSIRDVRRLSLALATGDSVHCKPILLVKGPLHDSVTWYKITHAGEQAAQWDFQNNATLLVRNFF